MKYEDRHRELAMAVGVGAGERLTNFEDRTGALVDEVVAEAREVVARFIGYAEGKYVALLDEKLAKLDEEASK